ncbi:hypothetical protein TcasGA2_TC013619 [Tribolium castaneum]|uniref:Uncharacterized protein n=1 Tax=Tribolium castaneum TaxID=7070 RepID=D6W6Y7_TRICA|nr:hypothetical protein TcasGA2_TC013619 [Tribolium castaneum]
MTGGFTALLNIHDAYSRQSPHFSATESAEKSATFKSLHELMTNTPKLRLDKLWTRPDLQIGAASLIFIAERAINLINSPNLEKQPISYD